MFNQMTRCHVISERDGDMRVPARASGARSVATSSGREARGAGTRYRVRDVKTLSLSEVVFWRLRLQSARLGHSVSTSRA